MNTDLLYLTAPLWVSLTFGVLACVFAQVKKRLTKSKLIKVYLTPGQVGLVINAFAYRAQYEDYYRYDLDIGYIDADGQKKIGKLIDDCIEILNIMQEAKDKWKQSQT